MENTAGHDMLDTKSNQGTAQHEDKFTASTEIQIMKTSSDEDTMMTDFKPISVQEESKIFTNDTWVGATRPNLLPLHCRE